MATAPSYKTPLQYLKKYTFGETSHRPLLFVGPKGAGKSYATMSMGYQKLREGKISAIFNIGGSDSFTSSMFLGHATIGKEKNVIWVDGKLSEAVRAASTATAPVLLNIDEILQIPGNVLSPLLSFMVVNPGTGKLHLNTGRVLGETDQGIAIQEILECDPMMIRIVATANEGHGYNSKEMNIALQDRFMKARIELSDAESATILIKKIAEYNLRTPGKGCLPASVHTSLLQLQAEQKKASQTGSLPSGDTAFFSIRTLSYILEMSEGTVNGLRSTAYDEVFKHCGQDSHGKAIVSQETVHYGLIEKFLGASVLKDDPMLVAALVGTSTKAAGSVVANSIIFKPTCNIQEVAQEITGICSNAARTQLVNGNYIDNNLVNINSLLFNAKNTWQIQAEISSNFSCTVSESILEKATSKKQSVNAAFKEELLIMRNVFTPVLQAKVDAIISALA